MTIPKGYVKVDTDDQLYRREDTKWLVEPTRDDPGILGTIPGAISKAEADADEEDRMCAEAEAPWTRIEEATE
jgi:hypothetical protein